MFSVFIRVGGPSLFVLGVSQWESLVLASMQRSIRSSINFISCCLNKKTMSCREIQFNGIVLIYSNNIYRIWEYPINMHIVPTPPLLPNTYGEARICRGEDEWRLPEGWMYVGIERPCVSCLLSYVKTHHKIFFCFGMDREFTYQKHSLNIM